VTPEPKSPITLTVYSPARELEYVTLPVLAAVPVRVPGVPSSIEVVFPAASPGISWTTSPSPAVPVQLTVITGFVPTIEAWEPSPVASRANM
jgi:hypothetical protein